MQGQNKNVWKSETLHVPKLSSVTEIASMPKLSGRWGGGVSPQLFAGCPTCKRDSAQMCLWRVKGHLFCDVDVLV